MSNIFNFFYSKTVRFFVNKAPRKCFAYKYILNPNYSYYIMTQKCDCIIWCKYPPSTKLKKL